MKEIIKNIWTAMEEAKSAIGTKQRIGKEKDQGKQYWLSLRANANGHNCLWSLFIGTHLRVSYDSENQWEWVVADMFEHYINA